MAFLYDSSRLISIGTTDRTIIQWQFFSESDSIALIDAKVSNQGPLGYAAPTDAALAARVADATLEELDQIETAQQVGAHLDTDSGDSDSDLSGGEIDSDIEREKQATYDRTWYREDYQVMGKRWATGKIHRENSFLRQKLKKAVKTKLPAGEKRKDAPDHGLSMEYVFG